ncbi:50S ribosomal protein L13 [Staphylococcus carnosus]|uniref:Large ribosomal subunit protein uL13 n=2 Tax=Staphylococcus carnosus TaxID=1281 RepID=RL13_STACT|nr:50S ribosomal protein L13 [Staphylococcus carnosus]Q00990.1 RecName: Full=Large ribosomal subunit protein uL13; AltName: Full=50S ribosomal protein L13 [Staphylococcus carnosus subsp. carnosus TM300]ANZ32787.1 50S ribosomal protein L13 [Staphylococcus carnosus]KKB25236.1 50S ribosomal protein L13 [Staphylococcus carnosus]KOR12755.1 50S ribosomal protein L13 [Staphylococcus carnosus]POA02306.1 50S ribosomal protein L13 [Staphylococcus carnosus]QPT04699.1 50S ribosomal protein L13 [Staphyloc
MRQTFMANESNIERKWYVIDAAGQTLGRLSSEVASILRGKHKATYTPHVDSGDYVIIINAGQIEMTGKKASDKVYYRHSNYPGGIKSITAGELREKNPERLLEISIKGMLPSSRLGEKQGKKLFVYGGAEHPHAAQQPENYELRG